MLVESPIDLVARRKVTLARCPEAAIDPGKLCWCRSVLAGHEAGIDFKRDLGKLRLGLFRPIFCAFQNVSEKFACHDRSMAYRPIWRCRKIGPGQPDHFISCSNFRASPSKA
jgi:hypothetical protein